MATIEINALGASKSMQGSGSNYGIQHFAATADNLSGSLQVGQSLSAGNYYIHRIALLIDTSGIPAGADITSVVMQINPNDPGVADKNWDIVIRNGQPTYPHNPVVVGDYLYSHYSDDGGSVTVSTLNIGAWNDITMNATGRGWIQKGTGAVTKLALISSKDISETAPSAFEAITLASIRIVVTYTLVVVVTTQNPTDIERADPTTLTTNALIELDVAEDITTRGFKYGLTEADTWDESENGGGTYTEGTFSLTLTSLTADTTYYIRAYAIVAGGYGTTYGSYLEFKTAYPYGPVKTEIKSEATASSSDIAAVGGKRSLTIDNHLIQTQALADLISAAYLADYKDQKTKLVLTRPTPAPFEIGDTIERSGALLPYYAAASALISYAPAATAVHYYNLAGRDMIIRKLNIGFSAGNYTSVIELESS